MIMPQPYFDTRFTYNEKREVVWRPLASYLQRFIPKEACIMELGAGYCHFINNIKAKEKHCIDTFAGLPDYADQDVTVHVGSSCDMHHIDNEKFNIVFASNFLEHLTRNEADTTLKEAYRIIKKNGKIILLQPNYRYCANLYFDDYTHETVYTHISLPQFLASCGFTPTLVQPKFIPFSMNTNIPKAAWLVSLYLKLPIKPFAKQMLVVAEKSTLKRTT